MSRYRLMLHFDIESRDDEDAVVAAKKLGDMLKSPLVRMSLESDGIRPVGNAVVYQPTKV